jgi:hypothetical protein
MTSSSVPYIILRNSEEHDADPKEGHWFRVVHQTGFAETLDKGSDQIDRTIGGKPDVQITPITRTLNYTIRVRDTLDTLDDANYGVLGDLQDYYTQNNPQGSPSNLIYLEDFRGVEVTGFLVGKFTPQPITTQIVGSDAIFFVPITFIQKDAV